MTAATNPQLVAGWNIQVNGNEALTGNAPDLSLSSGLKNTGLLGYSFDPQTAQVPYLLAVAGSVYASAIPLAQENTVSKLWYDVTAAGATLTSGQCFALLFNSAGTLIGQSADQHTIWATAGLGGSAAGGTALVASATGSLSNLAAGTYYGAVVATGTTKPTFAASGADPLLVNAGLSAASANFLCAILATGVTTTPATVTMTSATVTGSSRIWFGLS
jgi:hypothetical protein